MFYYSITVTNNINFPQRKDYIDFSVLQQLSMDYMCVEFCVLIDEEYIYELFKKQYY
jgi:hypothetical protein